MLAQQPLSPLGAVVTGVAVDALSDEHTTMLRSLLAEHGVLVLPGQDVDDHQFLRFLHSFGPTTFTEGEVPVPGFDELNVISNVGRETSPRSSFHTDTSYVRNPPAYTALRAVDVPASGGQTLFTNQYAAYATLPADVRDRLAGRTVTHVVTGLDLGDDQESSAGALAVPGASAVGPNRGVPFDAQALHGDQWALAIGGRRHDRLSLRALHQGGQRARSPLVTRRRGDLGQPLRAAPRRPRRRAR